MSLFNSVLFTLHKKLQSKEASKEKIASIISAVLKTTVTKDQISIKDGVMALKTNPTVKMAILLKKDSLLQELKSNGVVKIN